MYTKPIVYKIYSVFVFVLSILGFLSSLGSSIYLLIAGFALQSLDLDGWILILISIASVLGGLVALFFSYMDFSSMFAFGCMIEHLKSGKNTAYKKPFFTLSGNVYSNFGAAIFIAVFILESLFLLALIIFTSITSKQLISLPLIPLIACLLSVFLTYVTYYVRFKSFGNLLTILSAEEPTEGMKAQLIEDKPNVLRGYCCFLYVLAIIMSVVTLISVGVVIFTLTNTIGIPAVILISIGMIISDIILWIDLAVKGCYFDNLGEMVEHFLIKYNLLESKGL